MHTVKNRDNRERVQQMRSCPRPQQHEHCRAELSRIHHRKMKACDCVEGKHQCEREHTRLLCPAASDNACSVLALDP